MIRNRSVSVPFPFNIHSIRVLYPFFTRSVRVLVPVLYLFHSRSQTRSLLGFFWSVLYVLFYFFLIALSKHLWLPCIFLSILCSAPPFLFLSTSSTYAQIRKWMDKSSWTKAERSPHEEHSRRLRKTKQSNTSMSWLTFIAVLFTNFAEGSTRITLNLDWAFTCEITSLKV